MAQKFKVASVLAGEAEFSSTRITVSMPNSVDRNLAVWCARANVKKSEIITRLVSDFLEAEGLQPDKEPKEVSVSY